MGVREGGWDSSSAERTRIQNFPTRKKEGGHETMVKNPVVLRIRGNTRKARPNTL